MPDGDLIALRIRLTGGKQVAAEAETAAKGVAKTGEATEAANAKAASSTAKLAKTATSLKTAGRALTSYVTLPVVGVGVAAGVMALDFEKSMRNVNSIAQLPEGQFGRLRQSVLDMAGPVKQSPKTLAEGLYDLVSSGFDANEALVVLRASALSASAGLTTTEVSTKATAAVINAYSLKATDATKVSDTLFETVNRGVLTYEELASTIGDVLPFSAQLGISLNEVGASISTMTKGGLSAPESVTRLKNAMVTLIKPGKALSERLDEIGMSGEELVKKKGFQGAIEEIIAPLHGNKEAIAALFPNIRALGGVLSLTGINAKRAGQDLNAFGDTAGATKKVLAEQEKSGAFKLERGWDELQVALIELGDKLLPVAVPLLIDLAHAGQSAVQWFTDLPGPMQTTVLAVAGLAALAGPMLIFASSVLTAGKNLASLKGTTTGGVLGKLGLAGAGVGVSQAAGGAIGGDLGNWVSKAGTGASLGFALGGPGGALAGGAIGGTIAAYEKLFGAQKKVSITQMKLKRDGQVIAAGMHQQRQAAAGLTNAENKVQTATAHHKTSTIHLHAAQRSLNQAIAVAGPNSQAAARAERKVANAVDAHRTALRRLHQAEKLRGVQLAEFKTIARNNVLNERNEINVLQSKAGKLNKEYTALKKSGAGQHELTTKAQQATAANHKLNEATAKMATTIAEAGSKAGPKFAEFLKKSEREVLEFGSAIATVEEKFAHLGQGLPGVGEHPGVGITPALKGGHPKKGDNAQAGHSRGLLFGARGRSPLADVEAAAITRREGGGSPASAGVGADVILDHMKVGRWFVKYIEDEEARR